MYKLYILVMTGVTALKPASISHSAAAKLAMLPLCCSAMPLASSQRCCSPRSAMPQAPALP